MRQWLSRFLLWSVIMLAGCGGETSQDQAGDAGGPVADGAQKTSGNATETQVGRPSRGQLVFLQCRSCHTLKEGEPHLTGPNLRGMFGATAGKKNGYVFSDALSESSIVWSADTLDAWLQEPRDYIPGNKMAFAGLPDERDRAELINFLQQETQ